MKFFIYSRKSVYTGRGESVENQIEMCKQYVFSKFSNVTDEDITIYEDEGFSGKNTNRPDFQRMLNETKIQKPDFIVCYRLDRISRSVSDFSTLIEELNNRSISLICIKEDFDTSKPMGKAMMYIASVFAQLERETIAERVRDNMLMLARTGRWLGGATPTGYTSERVQEIIIDGKVKTTCKLKEKPEELATVESMFEKFFEVRSIAGVVKYLMRQGVKSRGGSFYSNLGVKEILQNPVYCRADIDALNYFIAQKSDVCFEEKDCSDCGLLAYNKRDYTKKHAPRQTLDKWVIAVGKHKGLIPGRKWVAVQNIIKDNVRTGERPAQMLNDYSLLSGLLYCSKCNARMFAKMRSGTKLFDYICSSKQRGGIEICDCQNLGGQQTDDIVCEYLMQYANENSNIYKMLDELKSRLKNHQQQTPMEKLELQIKRCNDEIDNLINTLSQHALNKTLVERVNARITELETEMSELTAERAFMLKQVHYTDDREMQMKMLVGALASFKKNFKTLSIYDKRTFIKLLVPKIVWDGKNLHIFIDGE